MTARGLGGPRSPAYDTACDGRPKSISYKEPHRNAMMSRSTVSTALVGFVLSSAAAICAEGEVGFLVDRALAKLGPEGQAAWTLAGKLGQATVVRSIAGGKFIGEDGKDISLKQFPVVWYHQGDSSKQAGIIYEKATLNALRKYVEEGGGLALTGAALAMVRSLRIESVMTRLGGPGNDGGFAGLVPVLPKHPIFKDLKYAGRVVPVSNRGYPAFSDFHPGRGPTGGMLLAKAPSGSENPMAEYEIGKGRIIVMGWRLPHFAHADNPHRPNLERLAGNILNYLASPKEWQKVVINFRRGPPPSKRGQDHASPALAETNLKSLERAVTDLLTTFEGRYPNGRKYLARLSEIRASQKELLAKKDPSAKQLAQLEKEFDQLRREALLSNPLIDFDRILLVKRSENSPRLGLVQNWESNSSLPRSGFDNEITVLSDFRGEGKLNTLFKPDGGQFVGDVDMHFGAKKMLFSMPAKNRRFQVYEMAVDGTGLRQLPLITEPDVDNYDACYLPGGNILFTSTAPFTGVPCVGGSSHVSNIYVLDSKRKIRRLTFEQDHNWCPTVLNNGRVLYLRWEYSDIPHYVSRILFHMNPDGTEQMEYYGSNSYWPNAMFYARPCPGHPTKFAAIVGGHHDVPRMGELVIFDPAKGRREADGVVQRIPGYGKKVDPVIRDGLVRGSWPKFLHPWPLSDKYLLVSAKPSPQSRWGIYLVDVFDNMLLLKELPYYALFEPVPLKQVTPPQVIPEKVQPGRKDALVYVADMYTGGGLAGVPRGTVKKLRIYSYQFAYHGMGGQVNRVGLDGPWDVKRIIGTVPVEPDGSALFRVPANMPIALHPLDDEGKALQLMRSWMTAMPGETLSCVGCHESQSTSAPIRQTVALSKKPAEISPWYGPVRGFSFRREVQPVLDKHCVRCHKGQPDADSKNLPDFSARPPVHPKGKSNGYNSGTKFTPSYIALRSFVRSPSIESDIHMLVPGEYHADTTRLIQLLKKGHYDVKLDAEGWDRIVTWIDLHTPAHGTWHEIVGMKRVARQRDRRRAMNKLYANLDEDPEAIHPTIYSPATVQAASQNPALKTQEFQEAEIECLGWPFDGAEAKRRQNASGPASLSIDLGEGAKIDLVRIPAGEFVMGGSGHADESPRTRVSIESPFWMGRYEITNEQFARFDSTHDSRIESGDFLQFSVRERGYPVNGGRQPVSRVSLRRATDFCRWLSSKTKRTFTLPTEAQWEYACRAGTATPLWFGQTTNDFAPFANLADRSLRAVDTFGWGLPSGAVPPWRPAIDGMNDKYRVSAPVGSFKPNAWGLYDMHGNVSEWTRSAYRPYPYREDGQFSIEGRKVCRGGSWYDRPRRARSAFRQSYPSWQRVYDVGFRIICEMERKNVQ